MRTAVAAPDTNHTSSDMKPSLFVGTSDCPIDTHYGGPPIDKVII